MTCAAGTLYNVQLGNCDWEPNVVCDPSAATAVAAAVDDSSSFSPTPPPPIPTMEPTTYAPQTTLPPSSNVGIETALFYAARDIDRKLFLVQTPGDGGGGDINEGWSPSKLYTFHGFLRGLRIAYITEGGGGGLLGGDQTFYLGDTQDDADVAAGLVNIASFLAQSMKETIKYDACDENNWDVIDGKYPLSNACGQLGQSYQDYDCPEEYKHMQCDVDTDMALKATTQASWYGAPGPLFCGPTTLYPTTGYWDYTYTCDYSWEDPPRYCTDYPGQKGGRYDDSEATKNRNNRTDVMGCCWWGRGCVWYLRLFIYLYIYSLVRPLACIVLFYLRVRKMGTEERKKR